MDEASLEGLIEASDKLEKTARKLRLRLLQLQHTTEELTVAVQRLGENAALETLSPSEQAPQGPRTS